ncbi:hypothetical protein P154DRAFT_599436 [Amniculicola lignicola CBS 123094]|uniref:Uncharacterized protein n=1 Tax=Amniculicola lignicola CBS 123094 TaxID=1392246 RepID=A0A6A5WF07_9PLEO|nr:hypothetical protein P154DRAFT_599436 [Amniculicola lignicola CBS 123094]
MNSRTQNRPLSFAPGDDTSFMRTSRTGQRASVNPHHSTPKPPSGTPSIPTQQVEVVPESDNLGPTFNGMNLPASQDPLRHELAYTGERPYRSAITREPSRYAPSPVLAVPSVAGPRIAPQYQAHAPRSDMALQRQRRVTPIHRVQRSCVQTSMAVDREELHLNAPSRPLYSTAVDRVVVQHAISPAGHPQINRTFEAMGIPVAQEGSRWKKYCKWEAWMQPVGT